MTSPVRVVYRLEPTGRTEHETVERLLTERCPNPACGADWRPPRRTATPRQEGGRAYRCEACGEHFKATLVDADGRPVTTSRSWQAARELRERDEGPGRHQ